MPQLTRLDGPLDLGGFKTGAKTQTFGQWVLEQTGQGGFVGQFAAFAKSDRGFQRDGDVSAVFRRLSDAGAAPELVEALDDAELVWAAP